MNEIKEEIKFFNDKILDLVTMKNSILQMPSMLCFNFCLNEMLDICNVNNETGNKKYFELSQDFLNFLKKDIVLKNYDFGAYFTLIKKVKFMVDNKDKINSLEMYNYFNQLKLTYGKTYLYKLKELLILNLKQCENYDEFEYLIEIFINELLAKGYTYKFLNEIVKFYIHNNKFDTAEDFISFLVSTNEDYDVYIPIKNFGKDESYFIKNAFKEQKIILGKQVSREGKIFEQDTYYCHIYFKENDYYSGIIKHIKRLKSILNFARYYINSDIVLDKNKKCIIKANKKLEIEDKTLNEILSYSFFKGSEKIIDMSMSSLKKLTRYEEKEENVLTKDFYNIIDYSEKAGRQLTVDQFINKWIALETLYSKFSNKNGFEAVLTYAPQILAIDFFRKKLNITIKRSKINYQNIEEFIGDCYKGCVDTKIEKVRSLYYRKKLYEYKNIILKASMLRKTINEIEMKIKMDIHRIYIFRNKYVHTGDTKLDYDILQYYLCQILALSIDKTMKAINDLDSLYFQEPTWQSVFTNVINKYITLFDALNILSEEYKIDKELIIKKNEFMDKKDDIKNIIIKIILEKHIHVFEERDIEEIKKRKEARLERKNKIIIQRERIYVKSNFRHERKKYSNIS